MTEPACTCDPFEAPDGESHTRGCALRRGRLPRQGERLEFGKHRLSAVEAATAPAFRIETPAQADARFRRELERWARREGIEPVPDGEPEARDG